VSLILLIFLKLGPIQRREGTAVLPPRLLALSRQRFEAISAWI
jgi:hypothetical protein